MKKILLIGLISLIFLFGCLGQSDSGPTIISQQKSEKTTTQNTYFGIPIGQTTETRTDYTTQGLGSQPNLNVEIVQCNSSINILQGLGEVTDVFVTITNTGQGAAHNVSVSANASDEDAPYKNTQMVGTIEAGQSTSSKLTLDTQQGVPSLVTVRVSSSEGAGAQIQRNC